MPTPFVQLCSSASLSSSTSISCSASLSSSASISTSASLITQSAQPSTVPMATATVSEPLVSPRTSVQTELSSQTLALSLLSSSTSTDIINTHYHNSNLIWRTVSGRVDEVISSDHQRRVASRVIQWYGLIHST